MKNVKHIFVVLFILSISILTTKFLDLTNLFWITISAIFVGFFIFNLIIRKSGSFKRYFTSKYNFLTTKFRSKKTFEVSKELLFIKIIEVINNSSYKLVKIDKEKFEILAISPITSKSWGENIYIDFNDIEGRTIMNFCSSSLFQIYSWGKNEENYNDLLNKIENSFVI